MIKWLLKKLSGKKEEPGPGRRIVCMEISDEEITTVREVHEFIQSQRNHWKDATRLSMAFSSIYHKFDELGKEDK